MRKISSYVVAATVLLALALCPVVARADQTEIITLGSIVYDQFTTPSNFGTLFPGPYATVTVDLTSSTTANITFASSGLFYMGDGGAAALNVNGSYTLSSLMDTANVVAVSSGGVDNAGTFSLVIYNSDASGGPGLVQTISFTLTDTSGSWADPADVLVANGDGNEALSHIHVQPGGLCTVTSGNCHAYAGVPEPPVSALLACSALLFGGLFLRRPLWS